MNMDRYTYDVSTITYTAGCDRCGVPCQWRSVLGGQTTVLCPVCDPVASKLYVPARTSP